MRTWKRDKRGRLYWYDTETGKRLKAPSDAERPRAYRKDKRGRGYWTWLDTGRRAPKPSWDAAPRYDRAGRPLDTTGRRVPRAALQAEPVLGPPREPPSQKPPKRKKAASPVRPRIPPRARSQVRSGTETIPGFVTGKMSPYTTKPTHSGPVDLGHIFMQWLKGAVRKSPMASASEIGIRQFGVAFTATAPLDMKGLSELTDSLRGQPVRLVYRATGPSEWEIWMHGNRPNRRTGEVEQKGFRRVRDTFDDIERAANIIWDFLAEWDADFFWNLYIETEDFLYEG
jgi:hypothetical protein